MEFTSIAKAIADKWQSKNLSSKNAAYKILYHAGVEGKCVFASQNYLFLVIIGYEYKQMGAVKTIEYKQRNRCNIQGR